MKREDVFITLCSDELRVLSELMNRVFLNVYESTTVRDLGFGSVVAALVLLAPEEYVPPRGRCRERAKLHVLLPSHVYAKLRRLRDTYRRTYREIVMHSLERLLERHGSLEDVARVVSEVILSTPGLARNRRHKYTVQTKARTGYGEVGV